MKTQLSIPPAPYFLRDAGKFGLSESRMLTIEHESGDLRSVLATVNEAHICEEHGTFEGVAALFAAAPDLLNVLIQAIESSGFSLAGPTDWRAAEHGEPQWVCNARGEIAKALIKHA